MPRVVAWNVQHQGVYEKLNPMLWEIGAHAAFILEPGNGLVGKVTEVKGKMAKKAALLQQVASTKSSLDKLSMADRRAAEYEGQYSMEWISCGNGRDIVVMFLPNAIDGNKVYHIDLGDRKIGVIKVSGIAIASGHAPYENASGAATSWTAKVLKACAAKNIDIFMGDVNLMGKSQDIGNYETMLASPTSKGNEALDRVFLTKDYPETADFTSGRIINSNSSNPVPGLTTDDLNKGCNDVVIHMETKMAQYYAAPDHRPVYVDI